MSETKSITKWWWGWEPEKLELWLEEQEAEGWHLYSISGQIRFHFVKSEPRKMRYCADYQRVLTPEYMRIFKDAGWELVYSSMGWYIWKMEYTVERPDIYTDMDSLIGRNNRLIAVLAGFSLILIPCTMTLLGILDYDNNILYPLLGYYGVIWSFFGYCIYKLMSQNNKIKLKKSI